MDDPATPLASSDTHIRNASLTAALAGVMTVFGWLMCTLAAGALAAFVSMVLGIRPCWLVLLFALPLIWVLQLCGCLYARWAAAIAVLAVLLAGFYAACLVAVARIAGATGFSFGGAFRTGGFGLTLQVAELGLDAKAILVYAGAAIIAALLAARLARSRRGN